MRKMITCSSVTIGVLVTVLFSGYTLQLGCAQTDDQIDSNVNMNTRVIIMTAEEEARVAAKVPDSTTSWSYNSINVHEQKDMSTVDQRGTKHVARLRAVTVEELKKEKTAWPLPQYLPPIAGTKVVIHEQFYPGSTTRVTGATAYVEYDVPYKGRVYHISYSTYCSEKPYPVPQDPRIWVSASNPVVQQTVNINGRQATATRSTKSNTWTIRAFYTTGYSHLSADLPLDVLVQVVESLPVLQ